MGVVSIRMPPNLRAFHHKSFGHFKRMLGCKLRATATPTAKDRPLKAWPECQGKPNENVRSRASGLLCHVRPNLPRPAVWCSATNNTGSHPPARARRISSLLVESSSGRTSAVKPGQTGTTCSQSASRGQRKRGGFKATEVNGVKKTFCLFCFFCASCLYCLTCPLF